MCWIVDHIVPRSACSWGRLTGGWSHFYDHAGSFFAGGIVPGPQPVVLTAEDFPLLTKPSEDQQ
jgi:hypothetical protein